MIFVWLCSVCFNVSGLGVSPGQDGDPRSLILINHTDLVGRSMVQDLKLPFDCQAIFLSPHADFSDPAR